MGIVVEHVTNTGRTRTRRPVRPLDRARQDQAEAATGIGYRLAHRAARRGRLDLAEAIGAALHGVTAAVASYDPDVGPPFPLFCTVVVARKLTEAADRQVRYATLNRQHDAGHQDGQVPDAHEPEPDRKAEAAEVIGRLRRHLPPKMFAALWARYAEERTLEEVGAILGGVSKERARQVVLAAAEKARRLFPSLTRS